MILSLNLTLQAWSILQTQGPYGVPYLYVYPRTAYISSTREDRTDCGTVDAYYGGADSGADGAAPLAFLRNQRMVPLRWPSPRHPLHWPSSVMMFTVPQSVWSSRVGGKLPLPSMLTCAPHFGDVVAFNRPNTRTTELVFMLGDNLKQDKAGFAPFGKIASKAGQLKPHHYYCPTTTAAPPPLLPHHHYCPTSMYPNARPWWIATGSFRCTKIRSTLSGSFSRLRSTVHFMLTCVIPTTPSL